MQFDPVYTAGIQKAINELAKQRLTCDGQFGAKSQTALKLYQAKCGIPQTGVYDVATQVRMEPHILKKYLTFKSINAAAAALKVQEAHIRTVCEVESKGSGYLPDGRIKILFERHHFIASLKKRLPAGTVAQLQRSNPDIINSEPGGYIGNEGEYARFERACAIDEYSAIYATSFGLFQIMGFNHAAAGYSDIFAYADAMRASETNQLMAFVNFNKTYRKGVLWTALKSTDWPVYAYNYNGAGYKKYSYDTKLSAAFAKFMKNIFAY